MKSRGGVRVGLAVGVGKVVPVVLHFLKKLYKARNFEFRFTTQKNWSVSLMGVSLTGQLSSEMAVQ
jgi:hypothetical protein